ncbi:Transketolase, N-terminal section [Mucinivorans hirudinis]|uniref:Transketolase, N-terminal section n=1 Tax=Mucinivorans hirudinis TaxID=1433126 RepID=A0A060RA19_9BACT|nr:Transketolase, N-terminal section [Mucinivorans hirudinis]
MNNIKNLEKIAAQVRRDIVRMVAAVNSGHPGGSMSATDVVTALFFDVMDAEPAKFTREGKGEDMFFLSNGHISPVLYSVMARRGYFPVSELATFRLLGSNLQGHPTPRHLDTIRVASGSLGQGLSVALGVGLAKKLDGDTHKIFVLTGDGELQEGQIWEAAAFATARKIDNVIAIVDWNNQQIDGTCEEVLSQGEGSFRGKFEAFGWRVLEVDGHNMDEVIKTLRYAKENACGKGKPVVILAKTIMGKGVSFMENTNEFHGKATSAQQTEQALRELPTTDLGDY